MSELVASAPRGKQITAKKDNVLAVYRFIGKWVFLKVNNIQYASNLIKQIESKGGKIYHNRGWIKCDLFGEHTEAKLGGLTLDLTKTSEETIQESLFNFFYGTLEKVSFELEVSNL